jgi:ankyrin repeat protein
MRVLKNKIFLPFSIETIKILIEEGGDPHIKNKNGKSPMDLAAESGEKELLELLQSSKPA